MAAFIEMASRLGQEHGGGEGQREARTGGEGVGAGPLGVSLIS